MSPVATRRPAARCRGAGVQSPPPAVVRCAVYTRKSTNEGLDSGFSSIDNQREACEAYILSQKSRGWVFNGESFDDGGFSGGNLERPALQRLIAAIQAGRVDCVVVYKIDRLSRSLLDFARLWEVFEQHTVAFVSVTQQINTTTSAGRLMLNVLISFAQFEREIISERTSDKMCAARRKGKWMGGPPILGYDIDREKHGLVVNEDEAIIVREIFDLYRRCQSSLKVAVELNRRGWTTKSWTRRNGGTAPPYPWDKTRVLRVLTNVTYTGKVRHKGKLYEGEHAAIVEEALFTEVQAILDGHGYGGGPASRNTHGALLKGLIRCRACGAAMAHTYTKKTNGRLYRYYTCNTRQKQGRHACDTPSLAAQDVEDFVVGRIKAVGRDPRLVESVCTEAVRLQQEQIPRLEGEITRLTRDRRKQAGEIRRLIGVLSSSEAPLPSVRAHLRAREETLTRIEARLVELKRSRAGMRTRTLDAGHLREILARFDPLWEVLHTAERIALIRQIVSQVVYDAGTGRIIISLVSAEGHRNPDDSPLNQTAAG